MLVSIVIPCYNSEHTIGKVVELAVEEFGKLEDYDCEFVLVNDYSRDGTWKAIQGLAERYPNVERDKSGEEFRSAQCNYGRVFQNRGRSDHRNGR